MKKIFTAVAVLAVALTVAGCSAEQPSVRFKRLGSQGPIVAEVWIRADEDGALIQGDAEQDVVYLQRSLGREALPDTKYCPRYDLNRLGDLNAEDGKDVPVAMYHLVGLDGVTVGYYKRRFARGAHGVELAR